MSQLKEKFGELPALDADSIAKFLAQQAAGKTASWAATAAFKYLFGGNDMSEVNRKLDQILSNQKEILSKLEKILVELKWEHLITRAFDAETNIQSYAKQLRMIGGLERKKERKTEGKRLARSIVSSGSDGLFTCLTRINDVLIGKSSLDPEQKGLLELWQMRLHERMTPPKPSLAILNYVEMLDAYLTAVFHLQFIGITLYVSAQSAEPDSNGQEMAMKMVKQTAAALAKQSITLETFIPPSARYFTKHNDSYHWIGYADSSIKHALSGNEATSRHNDSCVVYIDKRRSEDKTQQWQFCHSTSFSKTGTFAIGKRVRGTREHPGGFLCWSKLPIWRIACWEANNGNADHWYVIPVFGKNRKANCVTIWCERGWLWHSHNGFEQADYGKKDFIWELSSVPQ